MGTHDFDRAWDEYEWERFLQQQDKKTERYMELLEKYMDDPDRDAIVAREMGWSTADDGDEGIDEAEEDEEGEALSGLEQVLNPTEGFEQHELYRTAFALTIWLDQLFDANGGIQNEPAAVKLATNTALASAKLAAALSDEEGEELGMTIAYLKRALKAITNALEAGLQLAEQKALPPEQQAGLQSRLFEVRDGVISLMGEFRGEWLRRYGEL